MKLTRTQREAISTLAVRGSRAFALGYGKRTKDALVQRGLVGYAYAADEYKLTDEGFEAFAPRTAALDGRD